MPVAWFICTYKQRNPRSRYCAMDDYTPLIVADGGGWSESEVLGGYALVKVRASDTTLNTIATDTLFTRIPRAVRLSDSLSTLTTAQRNALRNKVLEMGYTSAEITAALGNNLGQRTLGDVLRFCASRRLKPRYDAVQDQIVLDGIYQECRPIADVDSAVTDV